MKNPFLYLPHTLILSIKDLGDKLIKPSIFLCFGETHLSLHGWISDYGEGTDCVTIEIHEIRGSLNEICAYLGVESGCNENLLTVKKSTLVQFTPEIASTYPFETLSHLKLGDYCMTNGSDKIYYVLKGDHEEGKHFVNIPTLHRSDSGEVVFESLINTKVHNITEAVMKSLEHAK